MRHRRGSLFWLRHTPFPFTTIQPLSYSKPRGPSGQSWTCKTTGNQRVTRVGSRQETRTASFRPLSVIFLVICLTSISFCLPVSNLYRRKKGSNVRLYSAYQCCVCRRPRTTTRNTVCVWENNWEYIYAAVSTETGCTMLQNPFSVVNICVCRMVLKHFLSVFRMSQVSYKNRGITILTVTFPARPHLQVQYNVTFIVVKQT